MAPQLEDLDRQLKQSILMMKKLMMMMTSLRRMRMRSEHLGTCSIALFPFWCLDAKGGEVVLFRFSEGICKGSDTSLFVFVFYLLACVHLS